MENSRPLSDLQRGTGRPCVCLFHWRTHTAALHSYFSYVCVSLGRVLGTAPPPPPMHKARVTEFRRNMIDRAKLGQRPPTPFRGSAQCAYRYDSREISCRRAKAWRLNRASATRLKARSFIFTLSRQFPSIADTVFTVTKLSLLFPSEKKLLSSAERCAFVFRVKDSSSVCERKINISLQCKALWSFNVEYLCCKYFTHIKLCGLCDSRVRSLTYIPNQF